MKRTIKIISLALMLILLAACSGNGTATEPVSEPDPLGTAIEPGTPTLPVKQGAVYMENLEVLPGKSADELIFHLTGNLPTACSQLTLTASRADGTNKIEVVAYSSEPADKMCAQVLTAFDEQVSLPGLKEGSYDIYFNGELVQTLSVPLSTK